MHRIANRTVARILILCFTVLLLPAVALCADTWSFAVVSDNHAAFDRYRQVLDEIRTVTGSGKQGSRVADFVLNCGDSSPQAPNHAVFGGVFKGSGTRLLPVRGNHENRMDVNFMERTILPSWGQRLHRKDLEGINYSLDWRNVRVIVIDQYASRGNALDSHDILDWIEERILSAHADHVFLAFHEPRIPWNPLKDPFWSLVLRHSDKVRAVFSGHLHSYGHRSLPGEYGDVDMIIAGNAGQATHSDGKQTIVQVVVDQDRVTFRTLQAGSGTGDFQMKEQWSRGVPDQVSGAALSARKTNDL